MAEEIFQAISIIENSTEANEEENVYNEREGEKVYSIDKDGEIVCNEERSGVIMGEEEKRILRIIRKIENQRGRACYQNVLEFARRENKTINMDIYKFIMLDLSKKNLIINKGKVGKPESFKIVKQTCEEKDTTCEEKDTTSSEDLNASESLEDICKFFDDKFLLTISNMIKQEVNDALNNKKNNCACDVNVNENNIYLENKYLKESINTQQGEIMFLRNELLSRNKTIEMLIGDKNKTENSKRHAITVNLDTENINSQIPIKEKYTEVKKKSENNHKRSIVILGDSIIKDIEQHRVRKSLPNNEKVYVKSFSGATIKHMHSYAQPSKEFNNDLVILHCGTNDLRTEKEPLEIAKEVIELALEMKSTNNEVMVSGIVSRRDKLNDKSKEVNKLLQSLCISKKLLFIDNSNINPVYHLNNSGLHLNMRTVGPRVVI